MVVMSHLKSKQEIGLFMVIQQALFLKITILAHRFMLSTILAWITQGFNIDRLGSIFYQAAQPMLSMIIALHMTISLF